MMIDFATLLPFDVLIGFALAAMALNLMPGSDVMFATACGMTGGPKSGIAAAFGISLGSLCHVLLTAFGLSAFLMALPWAFETIKWLGVGYLIYLAINMWRSGQTTANGHMYMSVQDAIKRGMLTNLLNPKVALFILALLPQFSDTDRGPLWLQLLLLGLFFTISGFVITAIYGASAGALGKYLKTHTNTLNTFSAIIIGALAVRLAWN